MLFAKGTGSSEFDFSMSQSLSLFEFQDLKFFPKFSFFSPPASSNSNIMSGSRDLLSSNRGCSSNETPGPTKAVFFIGGRREEGGGSDKLF